MISGTRRDPIDHIQLIRGRTVYSNPIPLTYIAVRYSMARLAGVCMKMLWPLDEGAAVPLCVRTVDQSAPDRRWRRRIGSWRPAACLCALCG
jgi:hypothetical protein